ncbi:MAG: restriction endonuclease subunit S, partial [bacterium]
RDGTHNPPKRKSKGIPLLTGTMFDDGIINYEKATFISTEDYKKIHSKYKPEEGDIVITKIGTLGRVALLRKKDIPIAIHCNSALLRANKSKIDSMFLFYLLKSNYFQEELNKRKGQTVQEFINLTSLGQIKVVVPESRKFEKFKYEVRPFYNLFFKLKDENQTLSQLRDTLLPKLMSGEIRVDLNNGEIVMKNNED